MSPVPRVMPSEPIGAALARSWLSLPKIAAGYLLAGCVGAGIIAGGHVMLAAYHPVAPKPNVVLPFVDLPVVHIDTSKPESTTHPEPATDAPAIVSMLDSRHADQPTTNSSTIDSSPNRTVDLRIAGTGDVVSREAENQDAERRAVQLTAQIPMQNLKILKVLQTCDSEAANPNDPRKPRSIVGVTWNQLKVKPQEAISHCEIATRVMPSDPRYLYQLARAISIVDPKRAAKIFELLVKNQYPAAYSHYGWALLDRRFGRNDLTGAVRAFEAGIQAGDSNSMISLADLIKAGKVSYGRADEALNLYRRAAALGNADAVTAIRRLQQEADNVGKLNKMQEDAQNKEQAVRLMMGIMAGILGNPLRWERTSEGKR